MRSRTNHKFAASEENHLVIDEQHSTEMHLPVALAHEAPAFALVEIGPPLFEFPLAPVLESLESRSPIPVR